jgi:transposase
LRAEPRQYDKELYKARHLIENFFCKLKQFCVIATRSMKPRETSSPLFISLPPRYASIEGVTAGVLR